MALHLREDELIDIINTQMLELELNYKCKLMPKFLSVPTLKECCVNTIVENPDASVSSLVHITIPSPLRRELLERFTEQAGRVLDCELAETIVLSLIDKYTTSIDLATLLESNPTKEGNVLNVLTSKTGKLTFLRTSVGAEILVPMCSHLSNLQTLDMHNTCLSDADVYLLSSSVSNLVELKFSLEEDSTIDSLYYLKKLRALEVLELQPFCIHQHSIIASLLHVLPHLRIAGTRIGKALHGHALLPLPHTVPLKRKPLALEHLVVVSSQFSYNQAEMLPNLKALYVVFKSAQLEQLHHFSKLDNLHLDFPREQDLEIMLAVYGNQLKTLSINKAIPELELKGIVWLCPNLVTLEVSNSIISPSAVGFAGGAMLCTALQHITIDYAISRLEFPPHLLPELLSMPNLQNLELKSIDLMSIEDWEEAAKMACDGRLKNLKMFHVKINAFNKLVGIGHYLIAQDCMVEIYNHSPKLVDRANCTLSYVFELHSI